MKTRKIFLLLTVTLLFIGLSYATEVSNDTTNTKDTNIADTNKEVVTSSNTPIKEVENTITNKSNTKEISKQNNDKTVKTASKTIDVNDFDTLHDTLTSSIYNTVILNIKSNILLTDDTELNEAIKTLTINGNGKTIDGVDEYQFLEIKSNNKVTIKNIKITNCDSWYDGGAIRNYGNLTIKDSILNNNKADKGGAIYNDGNLTIKDSILNNNDANHGGAIYNDDTLTIINTTLNQNNAGFYGGAIFNYDGTINISDTTFNKNIVELYNGGAIYISGGTLNIKKSTLNYNKAENNGGAIFNSDGTVIITDTTLKNNNAMAGGAISNNDFLTITNSIINTNKAEFSGGAIINNDWGKMTINKSQFNNNKASNGGAISNSGTLIINNSSLNNNNANNRGGTITISVDDYYEEESKKECSLIINSTTFNNNTATEEGGAIFHSYGYLNITKSVLSNNTASEGSAIYNNYNTLIKNNTFKTNKAKIGKKVIVDYNEEAEIKDNINNEISKDYGTIYTNGLNVQILKNIFDDGRTNTKITINKIANTQYTDNATIKGTLKTSSGTALKSTTLNISINGKKYTTKTDANGTFTYKYKTNTVGKNNVTVSYAGNTKYAGTTTQTTFNVTTKATKITINKIANTQYTDNATIKGTFKSSSGKTLGFLTLTVKINGVKVGTTKTNVNGTFTYKYQTQKVGTNNITVTYEGGSKYKATSTKSTFNVTTKATKITINKIANTQYTDNATIKGTLKSTNGKTLGYLTLTVKVNGAKVGTTKTNANGTFTYKYKTQKVGTNNITITYEGATKYKTTTTKTIFNVTAKKTKITINTISKTKIGNNATITGKYTDTSGNNLRNTPLTVTINGKKYTTKTDTDGKYTLTYKTTTVGTNNVTVSYAGNTRYVRASTSKTFTVVK